MNDSPTPAEIDPPPPSPADPTSRANELLGRPPTPEERAVLSLLESPGSGVDSESLSATESPGSPAVATDESAAPTPWGTLEDVSDPVPILSAWLADPAWTGWSTSHRQRGIVLPTGVVPPAPPPEATVPVEGADGVEPPPTPVETSVPVPIRSVALCGGGKDAGFILDPAEVGRREAWSALLRLACWGAAPLGTVVPAMVPGDEIRGWSEVFAAQRVPVVPGDVALTIPVSGVPGVCVALMEDVRHQTPVGFVYAGDVILLLGHWADPEVPLRDLAGSAYLCHRSFPEPGTPAPIDPEAAAVLCAVVRGLVHEGVLQSAMDCGRGGLAFCLAECCRSSVPDSATGAPLGARIELPQPSPAATPAEGSAESEAPAPPPAPRLDVLLFGEAPHRLVVSVAAVDAGRVLKQCRIMGVPATRLGTVGGDALVFQSGEREFRLPLATTGNADSTPSSVSPP